ncbi:hypothetical protein [Nocardia iowensis]|uniref:SnoaL-like domain-containing protein n=1 Tax=Nocardia iowensis TaxID=204891 RepID=A0ABX8RXC1_NOCIO|nr:hypothetical protein [Nocardia iowensis]QXN94319.1 hypothetical protein KV110_15430 [Nocardia iowensis]
MDRSTYDTYVSLYNSGDYRTVVDTYYTDDVSFVIYGKTVTHGAADTLRWLTEIHDGVTETLLIDEVISDGDNSLRVRAREKMECVRDTDKLATGPMHAGDVRIAPLDAHYLIRDGKFSRISLERGAGPVEVSFAAEGR